MTIDKSRKEALYMRDYSKAIELAIPDNLRLGTHSDAKLINSLIARLVVCSEENDSVWQKNRMACWNETIAKWNEEEFIPHIAKEDEDWNSLKSQIAANEAELASLRPKGTPVAYVIHYEKGPHGELEVNVPSMSSSIFITTSPGGEIDIRAARAKFDGKKVTAFGPTDYDAVKSAVEELGFKLVPAPKGVDPGGDTFTES